MRDALGSGTAIEVVRPSGDATRGVVVAPDIMGLRPLFDALCGRLANEHDWAIVAVEPFAGRESMPVDERLSAPQDDERLLGDLVAAADVLGTSRVAVLGFCMGGSLAFKAADSGRFDRAVGFYGMLRTPDNWRSATTVEPLAQLAKPGACPTLALLGGRDHWTPPADIEAARAIPNVEVVVYDDAEHGFVHDPDRPAHRAGDAADAWVKVAAFRATKAQPHERAATAGALTMVALCFSNGLQSGEFQGFSQATESIKHALHVSDFALGVVSFCTGLGGALGSILIATLCARHTRTKVLAGMFGVWAALMLCQGLARTFVIFFVFRVITSVTEATDPAAYPLLSDYWPVDQRAAKVSIFNAGGGVGAFVGLIGAGLLTDHFGWQWAFYMWVPFGILGALLMSTRREPQRGVQDAAYRDTFVELSDEAAALELADEALPPIELARTRWDVARQVLAIRSWRFVALGVGLSQIMQNGLMFWGTPYFKRTFDLTGTQVAALAPIAGAGSFLGLLGGGFLADRLLRRGVVRARVIVTAVGFIGAGIGYIGAFSTTSLAIALPLLTIGTTFATLPTGPQYAVLMDVTPAPLRPQASSVGNIVMFVSALGYPVVGGLSTLFGDNLRLAMLCVCPIYLVGGAFVLLARRTYVADVALVVSDAARN